jgi:hypothetical protein
MFAWSHKNVYLGSSSIDFSFFFHSVRKHSVNNRTNLAWEPWRWVRVVPDFCCWTCPKWCPFCCCDGCSALLKMRIWECEMMTRKWVQSCQQRIMYHLILQTGLLGWFSIHQIPLLTCHDSVGWHGPFLTCLQSVPVSARLRHWNINVYNRVPIRQWFCSYRCEWYHVT